MEIPIGSLVIQADFMVAYACGLVLLMLFCIERFNLPTSVDGSFVETLVPKAVSSGFQYTKAFAIYVMTLICVYTCLSIIGPYLFAALGFVDPTAGFKAGEKVASDATGALSAEPLVVPAWVPLAILLILTGGATHFRMLNQVEFFARRITHRLIGIPNDVERLAEDIDDRRIALESLSATERNYVLTVYNQASGESLQSLTALEQALATNDVMRRWLRLCFLHFIMENGDLPANFEAVTRRTYRHVWEGVGAAIEAIRADPEQHRLLALASDKAEGADRERRRILVQNLNEALHDLHALIAVGLCPVRHNGAEAWRIVGALRLANGDVDDDALLNRVLLALIVLFFGVLVSVYATQSDPVVAFKWATGAFFLHGGAALSAWRFYDRRRRRGAWSEMRFSHMKIPTLQYIRVGVGGYIYGTLALILWYAIDYLLTNGALPRISSQLVWIPGYGALGVLTAFWVAYDFDVVQREGTSIVRRVFQVAMQGATTGAIAYFITITVMQVLGADGPAAAATAWRIGFITAVASGILGFFAVFLARRADARAERLELALDEV